MLKCKLVYPSLTVVGMADLPAKPQRGDYIQHNGVLYYVHGITMYSDGSRLEFREEIGYVTATQLLVKVTEA